MARPLTGFLPETLWYPEKKIEVISFLQDQPAPAAVRRAWLLLWAKWVGMGPSPLDYQKAERGAVEA